MSPSSVPTLKDDLNPLLVQRLAPRPIRTGGRVSAKPLDLMALGKYVRLIHSVCDILNQPVKHDYRLMSFDFRVISHVLTSSNYQKPWQTRSFLGRLIGRGKQH